MVEILTCHEIEDGVSQKLEALVVFQCKPGVLIEVRAVSHGSLEKAFVPELDVQVVF
jgi:hypothetical protein